MDIVFERKTWKRIEKKWGDHPNGTLESTPFAHIFFFLNWKPLYPPAIPQSKTSKDHRSFEGDACSIFKKMVQPGSPSENKLFVGVWLFFPLENLSHGPPFQNPPGFDVKPPELLGYCLVDASTACTVACQ